MTLHEAETQEWTDDNLESMIVFCLLDRAIPYERVCVTWEALRDNNMVTRNGIRDSTLEEIVKVLKSVSFRFPNQTGGFIKEFGDNPIDLRTANRQELVKNIKGIGMKLASMFLHRTRGETYAIIDIHIKRWLEEQGYDISTDYETLDDMDLPKCIGLIPYRDP